MPKWKLLGMLTALGISEEHIPSVTKKIDDLLVKKRSKNTDGAADNQDDSSISEYDVN